MSHAYVAGDELMGLVTTRKFLLFQCYQNGVKFWILKRGAVTPSGHMRSLAFMEGDELIVLRSRVEGHQIIYEQILPPPREQAVLVSFPICSWSPIPTILSQFQFSLLLPATLLLTFYDKLAVPVGDSERSPGNLKILSPAARAADAFGDILISPHVCSLSCSSLGLVGRSGDPSGPG